MRRGGIEAESLETRLTIYGFPALIWAVLVTLQREIFAEMRLSKGLWVMLPYWISVIFFLSGVAVSRKSVVLKALFSAISVLLGFAGLALLGWVGWRITWMRW